ncbi:hypothetical protein M0R19_03290 [Candidatus Pacearchaeota archaeon]|jgi:hypothetical protein|nr:hypothetical protein [Candidatus Pacearchaeota archaeon]
MNFHINIGDKVCCVGSFSVFGTVYSLGINSNKEQICIILWDDAPEYPDVQKIEKLVKII